MEVKISFIFSGWPMYSLLTDKNAAIAPDTCGAAILVPPFRIFEAFRFPERQEDLYAQGRTKPGNIVTYAKPWTSFHQYGLAVDFVLYIDGNWSWNDVGTKEKWWNIMRQLGSDQGLMRLNFEKPHLQLAGVELKNLRNGIYPSNGDKFWIDNLTSAKRK